MRRDKKEVRSGQEAGFSAEPTRIDMQSSTRSLDETARQTSAGRRIVGVLASGLGRRSSSHYSPTDSPNSPSLLAKRQFAFPILAVLAVAALGLWLLLPGGALRAQDATIMYPENGTDPVVTYTAVDPEGKSIVWSLAGNDMDDFSIENGVLRFKSSPDFENPANDNNTYAVTVQASAGTSAEPAIKTDERPVTVTVTNVDEAGTLTLSTLQPVDGIDVTTTLTDIDSVTNADPSGAVTDTEDTDLTWKWAKSSSKTGAYTDIEGAAMASYTPKPADINHYLRATATYTDPQGSGKTVMATTANRVLVTRSTNTAPVFKDADGDEIPAATEITREVAENTPKGVVVGVPVAATDSEGDVLTYTLGGTNGELFSIDVATGQLRTSAALNREATNGESYTVMVTATDPYVRGSESINYSDMITVTINVTNVNEDPKVTGEPSPRVAENTAAATPVATTYTATDDEDDAGTGDVVLTLSGTDAASFSLTEGVLTFKALPNFEAPKDAGKDNAYNITVVATDSDGQTDEMDVTVTVTNVEEDGTVTLSLLQPRIGTALTATLTDIDGAVSDVKWQWAKSTSQSSFVDIDEATASSYTPVMDDDMNYLQATARYTDPEGSGKSAMSVPTETDFKAVEIDDTNRAPEFPDQDLKMDGDQTDQAREIEENREAAQSIGDPVTATDPNVGDTLTYSLGGTDGASFGIVRSSGQLQTKASLDREEQDVHIVTVTATDPSGLSATVNVTINITNVDEAPTLTGPGSPRVAENTPTATAVATYVAMDDEDDNTGTAIRWSLDDAGDMDFSITGGVLRFKSAPNYETDSTYNIMVIATDSDDAPAELAVTVNVMNVDEAGTLTLSTLQPVDGIDVTTTLTDIDGAVTSPTWKWAKSSSRMGAYTDIEGETAISYTPKPADLNHYLRGTATYTDPQGSGKTAVATTANKVLVSRSTNTPPVFKDADDMEITNGITREVAENTPKGVAVGAPVAAADSEGDVLTYTLGGANGELFSIDVATGQLRTSAALNREATNGERATRSRSRRRIRHVIGTESINYSDMIDGDHQCHQRERRPEGYRRAFTKGR